MTHSSLLSVTVQIDISGGQGHCWRDVDDTLSPEIREQIAAEIIDGGVGECEDYVATDGQHYRWS